MSSQNVRASVRPHRVTLVEALEGRRLMSATVHSTTGGVAADYTLGAHGVVVAQVGPRHRRISGVDAVYQAIDATGLQTAYALAGGELVRLTPRGTLSPVVAADKAEPAGEGVLVLDGSTLEAVVGGLVVPLPGRVKDLAADGTAAAVRIGNYVKADVNVRSAPGGVVTLAFSDVKVDVRRFAGTFLADAVADVQAVTGRLQPLADALDRPLISKDWGVSTVWMLRQLGYGDTADAVQQFADTITALNALSVADVRGHAWLDVGGFTASSAAPGGLQTVATTLGVSAADVTARIGGAWADLMARMNAIPGLHVGFDPADLLKLATGEDVTMFSYDLQTPALSFDYEQQLAAVPVAPELLTEVELTADLHAGVQAAATFGYDTRGFFVRHAAVSASLSAGLAGIVNVADLAGYRLGGDVGGTVAMRLRGADASGKVYFGKHSARQIVFSGPDFSFGISSKFLTPVQMIRLAVRQYAGYLKTLLGNDWHAVTRLLLHAKVSLSDVVSFLDTIEAVPVPGIAALLHRFNVGLVDLTAALVQGGISDVRQIAEALYGNVTDDLNAVARALGTLTQDAGQLVGALGSVVADADRVLLAVWNNVGGIHITDLAAAVWRQFGQAISWTELSAMLKPFASGVREVALCLKTAGADVAQIASAIWHTIGGLHLADLASVLGALQGDVGQVVRGLSTVVNDMGQVARAAWHYAGLVFNLNDLSHALWTEWNGVIGFALGPLAGALSSIASDARAVVGAMSVVTGDVEQIAEAVFHFWQGTTVLYASDLYKAAEQVFGRVVSGIEGFFDELESWF